MSSIKEGQRIVFLDMVKFFVMYHVIWGHTTQYAMEHSLEGEVFHPFAFVNNAFHMPLFMTLCGVFASSSLRYSAGELLKRKALQLLLPALVWTMCNIALLYIRGKNAFEIYPPMNWVVNYWFVECLFICYVLFWASIKLLKNEVVACIATLALVWSLDVGTFLWVSSMLPFFWLGHFMKRKIMEDGPNYPLLAGTGIAFILLLCGWSGDYTIYSNSSNFFSLRGLYFSSHNLFVMIYRILTGATGAVFFILLWKAIYGTVGMTRIGRFMSRYGRETLPMYMMHTMVIVAMSHVYALPKDTNIYLFEFGYAHLYNILAIVICILMIGIFDRFRITRLLFLGR